MATKSTIHIPIIGADAAKAKHAVPANLFGQPLNAHLLTQYIQMYLVNVRQGTASTKDRSQIIGSTRKIYKQKGTGNARHGSRKAPIFVGGGVVGGPKPKDYYLKMNKKQKTMAFVSALSSRLAQEEVALLQETSDAKDFKTKDILKIFDSYAPNTSITLVLSRPEDTNLHRVARNLKNIRIAFVQSLNPYEILQGKRLVFSTTALTKLTKSTKS